MRQQEGITHRPDEANTSERANTQVQIPYARSHFNIELSPDTAKHSNIECGRANTSSMGPFVSHHVISQRHTLGDYVYVLHVVAMQTGCHCAQASDGAKVQQVGCKLDNLS